MSRAGRLEDAMGGGQDGEKLRKWSAGRKPEPEPVKCYFVEFWLKGKLLRNEQEDSSLQEMFLAGGINMDTSRLLYQ